MKEYQMYRCTITAFIPKMDADDRNVKEELHDLMKMLEEDESVDYVDGPRQVFWSYDLEKPPLRLCTKLSNEYRRLGFCVSCENYDSGEKDYRFFYKAGIMTAYLEDDGEKGWVNKPVGISIWNGLEE